MKRMLVLTLLCPLMFLLSCAQQKQIPRAFLFSKESIPGIIPVGIEGQHIPVNRDTLHIIYMEVKGSLPPVIQTIIYKGRAYSSGVYPVDPREYAIGKRKDKGDSVRLHPVKGNSVWRIELSPSVQNIPILYPSNQLMIIKGRLGNKPFRYVFEKETELEPDIHV